VAFLARAGDTETDGLRIQADTSYFYRTPFVFAGAPARSDPRARRIGVSWASGLGCSLKMKREAAKF